MEDFNIWLRELSRFSGFAGVCYFIFFRKNLNSVYGLVFLVIFASFFADNLNYFFIKFVYPNGYIIGNIWYIVNFALISWLFLLLLNLRKTILIASFGFFIITAVSFIYFYSFTDSNSIIKVTSSLWFSYLSLVALFGLLKNPTGQLRNNPVFWIATGIFIYSSVTLLRNLFLQYLVFELNIELQAFYALATINLLSNSIKNLILFYSLILIDKGFSTSFNNREI